MKQQKIELVGALYKFNPEIDDTDLREIISVALCSGTVMDHNEHWPSEKTLSVWKARLRKRGVLIPDKRLRKKQ